ncbi:hypothetical protein FBEOM_7759 [Fusarium beomiforme]|uniref:Uncharacterized protein n=1 Tax=Fusarium beomiforme TaxID=44412 RepID=A0A9P5DUX2_9HYPO|nr:hypothetical protein FBEOM_7759 [Fusarium beomiforme]
MGSSPQRQQDSISASSSKATRPSESRRDNRTTEPISTSTPRQPDEIEEADSIVPVKKYQPKQKQNTVELSSDKHTDDAESVHLSSDEDTSDESSSDYDSDSDGSVQELPPRQLARRSTDRSVKTTPSSPSVITQTRSETTRWISTQDNGGVMRGARTVNQQTTMHGHNVGAPYRRPSNRNSVSFNMSVNVDMSFNGLVTGRNLGFTGVGILP